jgi:hypothetical protein
MSGESGRVYISVAALRSGLADTIYRCAVRKERRIVEQGGVPVAAIIAIDEYEELLEDARQMDAAAQKEH